MVIGQNRLVPGMRLVVAEDRSTAVCEALKLLQLIFDDEELQGIPRGLQGLTAEALERLWRKSIRALRAHNRKNEYEDPHSDVWINRERVCRKR